ncbi:VPLPA-CTERM sorting domain-containing protein [Roseovarius sp. CAU 1744]|uniref:VPLPA-CTERM sorting domain-containing protein n=1 Tax=Roseovarius sp. CAU 1744 TaxID=3140368 RepID=UPI00325ADCE0
MLFRSLKLAAAMALGLCAVSAHAATFTYSLGDHPDGAKTPTYEYGLRLDYYQRFFSFENGASSQLTYDDVAGTATISGTMRESLGNGVFGALWNVVYTMTGLTDMGGGTFVDTVGNGSGSISSGMTSLALGAKSNGTHYFVFKNDGHRLPGNPGTGLVGRGWVDPKPGLGGANDFLFTAKRDPGGGGVIPLPAAAWMLLSGVAGLGVLSRRRRRS